MPTSTCARPRRVLLAVLLSVIPFTGCVALGALQQTEQSEGGNGVQEPTSRSATDGSESARSESNRNTTRNPRMRTVEAGPIVRAEEPVLAGSAALAALVRAESEDWIGTRYRYGGTTRRGIDCSAFVRTVMSDALDIDLPRATAAQVELGEAVSRNDLLPADLVFFRRRGVRHVGIYLGDGEFIHASSTRGVIISSLLEGYYERHFWTARRVIENPKSFLSDADLARPTKPEELLRPGSARSSSRASQPGATTHGAGRGIR